MVAWHYLYVFHRDGTEVVYREWNRTQPREESEWKSVCGFLFTMRMFTAAIDPSAEQTIPLGTPLPAGQGCGFHACSTDTYKMTVLETPTGVKVVLVTEPTPRDLRGVVWAIYRDAYVPSVHRQHGSKGALDAARMDATLETLRTTSSTVS